MIADQLSDIQTREVVRARSWRPPAVLLSPAAMLVLLMMILSLLTSGADTARASTFVDVPSSLPAHDAIKFLTGVGAVSGFKDGSFAPARTLTRGQAAKVLVLWKNVPLVKTASSFSDVDSLYRTYVQTACAQGWMTGFPGGTFKPYSPLTRQQMATIMVRAMGWDNEARTLSAAKINETLATFSDRHAIASGARRYVVLAVARGLFEGTGDGHFRPANSITRAQLSLVVFRAELSSAAVLQGVRSSSSYPDKTRVVIDLSRAPGTVKAAVAADGTLAIDYTRGVIGGVFSQSIGSPEVKTVRARQLTYNPRTVRVSLDLSRYRSFSVMTLAPAGGKGHRIVVDVFRRAESPVTGGSTLVCIDPGHGGSDPGAIGVNGTKEKDVNLAISLLVAENLRAAGLRVMLTRTTDTYLSLQERTSMANTARADLFVSIHNNASGDAAARGTETFYWGTPDNFSSEGKALAAAIQRNLVKAIGSVDRGARTHWLNLAVLANTTMTAALTEVGFLSNAAEEARLVNSTYQKAAAQGIAKGILEYLRS